MNCYVTTEGIGEPIVLLHGWGMSSAVWQSVVKPLSLHRTVYLVDLPGMGQSATLGTYTLEHMAKAVLEAMPVSTDVLGWSLGGLVAQRIALDQPQRVRNLILVGSTPCFVSTSSVVESDKKPWQHGIAAHHFEQFSTKFNEDYATALFSFLTLQCMQSKEMRSTIKQLRQAFELKPTPNLSALQQSLQILLHTDLRPEIVQLQHRTLIIHGDRDTLVPVSAAHWLAMTLKQGLLRVIAGAAHAPFLSHAETFCEAILSFNEHQAAHQ